MWLTLDDGMPDHPRIIGLSDRAFRIHIEAMCWSAHALTDGFLPDSYVSHRRVPLPVLQELTIAERGPWTSIPGGFLIHDWLDYNLSAVEIRRRRKLATERQKRWRRRHEGSGDDASRDA